MAQADVLDFTHDAGLTSWVTSANTPLHDFPIQNLPFGRFIGSGERASVRTGVAIGDEVLDLAQLAALNAHPAALEAAMSALAQGDMNAFMAMGAEVRGALRRYLSAGLQAGSAQQQTWAACLCPQRAVVMLMPCQVGDYTDFYTGIHHATTVGTLFRPDNPLLPNYKWVPIGYHGRSSSIVVSGHPVHRPQGQTKGADDTPKVGPTQRLDYELELAFFVGQGNPLGQPIDIADAEAHWFGVSLFNDWSARDIQPWEYQPLGPFLSKNFLSTVSPWVVTLEALAPFRVPFTRPAGDPQPLPYLDSAQNRQSGSLAITLEVWLQTQAMRQAGLPAVKLAESPVAEAAYWTPAQLIAHHTQTGCNLQAGDLLGSGTLSGPDKAQAGSLLELTLAGQNPLTLPNGEVRRFLEDGDEVTFRGYCARPGARQIGFGECVGRVQAAR